MLRPLATRPLAQIGTLFLILSVVRGQAAGLKWTEQAGHRSATVESISGGKTGFQALSPQTTGIDFTNHVPAERHYANQILLNGSGVAAGDVDGDGWCDVFFCGLGGGSRLYRNLGNWNFRDVTGESGLSVGGDFDATGAALADFDGDADLDLIINSIGQGTIFFLNDGRGRFAPSPAAPILNRGYCGSSLALADTSDVDGDLHARVVTGVWAGVVAESSLATGG